ncbi:MAG: signal peptidase I [Thermodesulfovibrionales bacterium]
MKTSFQQKKHLRGPDFLTSEKTKADTHQLCGEILSGGAGLRIRVTGRSMKPFLKGGEILTIRRVSCASLRKGDLILFDSQGALVLHRIIKKVYSDKGTLMFQTQGDAMRAADGPVHQDKVLGKVLKIERSLAGGRTKQMDMESAYWRVISASTALMTPIRMLMRHTHSGFIIHVPALMNKLIRMVSFPQSRKLSGVGKVAASLREESLRPPENQENSGQARIGSSLGVDPTGMTNDILI